MRREKIFSMSWRNRKIKLKMWWLFRKGSLKSHLKDETLKVKGYVDVKVTVGKEKNEFGR